MARIIKDAAVRRNEILSSAKKIIYSVGYDSLTIQAILNDLKIPKGLFYHYFPSKQEMMIALLESITDQMEEVQKPILNDMRLNALEKMQAFFAETARWKLAQKELFLQLTRIWFSDSNLFVREKARKMVLRRIAPMLEKIIIQGVSEGAFSTSFPTQAAIMVVAIMQNFQEVLNVHFESAALLNPDFSAIETEVNAFSDGIEKILGAPKGSCQLIDLKLLEEWFNDCNTKMIGAS